MDQKLVRLVWELVQKGERVKDKSGSSGEQPVSKQAKIQSTSEEKRALVDNYEQQLHEDKYSRFQIKIWAEALASGQYSDLDTPPGYAMFG